MPRRPRVYFDGVLLHIVQRGHHRQPCFFAKEDCSADLHWLGGALKQKPCAFAPMTHYHTDPCKASLRATNPSFPPIQLKKTFARFNTSFE